MGLTPCIAVPACRAPTVSDCCSGSGHGFRLDYGKLDRLCLLCDHLLRRLGRKETHTRVSISTSNYLPDNSRSEMHQLSVHRGCLGMFVFLLTRLALVLFFHGHLWPGQDSQSFHVLISFVWIRKMVIFSTCLRNGWKLQHQELWDTWNKNVDQYIISAFLISS